MGRVWKLIIVAAWALSGICHAESLETDPVGPSNGSVAIEIGGSVPVRCALSEATQHLGVSEQEKASAFTFNLNCNTPFVYQLQSGFGGLRHSGAAPLAPYAYDIAIEAAVSDPTAPRVTLVTNCRSHVVCLGDSGDAVAVGDVKATVSLRWRDEALTVAGAWQDTLTLEISPQN